MDPDRPELTGLLIALGVGLLIGAMRERIAHPTAGLRTHALAGLTGGVAMWLGTDAFLVALAATGLFAYAGYRATRSDAPGLTSEVALVLTTALGGLAMHRPEVAAALGVVIAAMLNAKGPMHRFVREVLDEREIHDALLLLATGLVILPLLPDEPVDPWNVLKPAAIGRLVVLVMAVGMLGHVALRLVGARWGLPVAGFFSGFVSSTAATASFGEHARDARELRLYAVAAALLANLASLLLFAGVVGTVAPGLLKAAALPLGLAAAVALGGGLLGLYHAPSEAESLPPEPKSRSFRLRHALLFAAAVATVLLISAALQDWLGSRGALIAATLAALAEWHAAAATVAQLSAGGALDENEAVLGLVLLIAAGSTAKSVLAFVAGGRAYGLFVMLGLAAMTAAALVGGWLVRLD